jgi:hypothetical protein
VFSFKRKDYIKNFFKKKNLMKNIEKKEEGMVEKNKL